MLLLSYRGCWHRICRSFFLKLRHYLDIFMKGLYDQYNLHHPREIAGSSLRSVSKIPHCCLQIESGPYLSPSVTGHPLRPVKDHRLGMLLPHQLSNLTQAHQKTIIKSLNIHDSHEFFGRCLRVTHPFAMFLKHSTCMC